MQNPPPGQPAKSGVGLDQNVASAISYIWIVGLIFFFMEKENKFIRFHAMQSILYGISMSVLMIVLIIINVILAIIVTAVAGTAGSVVGSIVGLIVWLITALIWLVVPLLFLIGLILAAVKAYQGNMFKLPIVGNMAEKIVNK
jgi:uncharacterized membrane protein